MRKQVVAPRDIPYERLCKFAKDSYHSDLRVNPRLESDWHLAAAVSKLYGHPMAWLLQWAGVQVGVSKPWWDRLILLGAALMVIAASSASFLLAGEQPWSYASWTVIILVNGWIIGSIYLVSRRLESWQLIQAIRKYRTPSSEAR